MWRGVEDEPKLRQEKKACDLFSLPERLWLRDAASLIHSFLLAALSEVERQLRSADSRLSRNRACLFCIPLVNF